MRSSRGGGGKGGKLGDTSPGGRIRLRVNVDNSILSVTPFSLPIQTEKAKVIGKSEVSSACKTLFIYSANLSYMCLVIEADASASLESWLLMGGSGLY